MSSGLAKCVAMGPLLSGQGYSMYQDLHYLAGSNGNLGGLVDTRTPWVRIWVDWPSAQPKPNEFDTNYLKLIDYNIEQAKAHGLGVILTSYRFPLWANGTFGQDPNSFQLTDRLGNGDNAQPKPLEQRYPPDVSTSSPWAFWIYVLASRYNPVTRPLGQYGYVDILEIMNEPNLQYWPQRDGDNNLMVHRWAAGMIQTARETIKSTNNAPLLMAPATNDIKGSNRQRTDYQEFTNALLTRLGQNGFVEDNKLYWSQHNYGDVTYDLGTSSVATPANSTQDYTINRAAWTQKLLEGRGWKGWPGAGGYIALTEGGVTTQSIIDKYGGSGAGIEAARSYLVARMFQRMKTDAGDGRNIALTTNYTFYGDARPQYDTGLYDGAAGKRPVYDTWKSY